MKKFLSAFFIMLGLSLLPLLLPLVPVWAQCTGVFPANTLCGNLSGAPQPPAAFSAGGTIVGPGFSTSGHVPTFANSSGTLLSDPATITTSQAFNFTGNTSVASLNGFLFSPRGQVNVVSYGAVCDGVTDDTTAISNAIFAAGGASRTLGTTYKVIIPGLCVTTSTLTVRANPAGSNFKIECTGLQTGLIWNGTDNTGPMLDLGDSTGAQLDGGVEIDNCFFNGKDNTHRPSIVVRANNDNNTRLINVTFAGSGVIPNLYKGFVCTAVNCQLWVIEHLQASCLDNCIDVATPAGGSIVQNSQFGYCGHYCIKLASGDSITLFQNYFEGTVAGTSGSVYLAGHNQRLLMNTFEDAPAVSNPSFLSVDCEVCISAQFNGNYFVGPNANQNYSYKISAGSTASWVNEDNLNSTAIKSIDYEEAASIAPFVGGVGCSLTTLVGGAHPEGVAIIGGCAGGGGTPIYGRGNTVPGAYNQQDAFSKDVNGRLRANIFIPAGGALDRPSYSGGCGPTFNAGASNAGETSFTITCNASSFTMTFPISASAGWNCSYNSKTNTNAIFRQTSSGVSSAVFTATVSANDIGSFICMGF